MGYLFDDLPVFIGGLAAFLLTLFCLAVVYVRYIKPRCCPQRQPVSTVDTQAAQPLSPVTIVQHLPPSQQTPQYPAPGHPTSPPQYYPTGPYYPLMQDMPPQHSYYPPPPTGALPPIPN